MPLFITGVHYICSVEIIKNLMNMAVNQTHKIIWLINTILDAGKISFEDINRKWKEDERMSGGVELLKRTFHKWQDVIFDTFGLIIENEHKGEYRYYIYNAEELEQNTIIRWMINTYSVANSLDDSKSIKDRIVLEDIPSGHKYLDAIISAMKTDRIVHITYYSYWRDDERNYTIAPYCVKLFRQRWYVVAELQGIDNLLIFSLDRIRQLRISERLTFTYPEDFSPEEYFRECYGVIVGDGIRAETVRMKVSAKQANYLRDLKMHKSQRETERNDDYSIFELKIRPSFDFQQEILWNGEDIEILEPNWLRNEIADKMKRICNLYKKKKL